MATLRNKTTEDGTIVRWAPHPNHNRPSTYQVTPRALKFLKEIGIKAPSPGDESDISWDICQPLRFLGDLHFKSESSDSVDTSTVGRSSHTLGKNLTQSQRKQLRSYIESHPNYSADAKRQLRGDVKKLPRDTPDKSGENDSDNTDVDIPKLGDVPSVEETQFINIGKIKQFTKNGGALQYSESGSVYNVSKLPAYSEHEWIVSTPIHDGYHLCVTPQTWDDRYRSQFRRKVDTFEERSGFKNLGRIQRIQTRPNPKSIEDSVLDVTVIAVQDGIGLAYKGPHTIVVEAPVLVPETRITVKILETWGNVARARPYIDTESTVVEGDVVNISVQGDTPHRTWATAENRLVQLPSDYVAPTENQRIGIDEISEYYMTGSVAALPQDERPTVGETVTVQNGVLQDYDGLPLNLPSGCPVVTEPYRVVVTEVTDGTINVAFDKTLAPEYEIGETLTVEPLRWSANAAEGVASRSPVRIENARYLPDEDLKARITGFTPEGIRADFEEVSSETEPVAPAKLVKNGAEQLRLRNFEQATRHFIQAVDGFANSKQAENHQAGVSEYYELLSFAAAHFQNNEYDTALRKLESGTTRQAFDILEDELAILVNIFEIAKLIQEIDRTESTEATAYRSDARRLSKQIVKECTEVQNTTPDSALVDESAMIPSESDRLFPHPVIIQIFCDVVDQLLMAPSSVKTYLENQDTTAYFTATVPSPSEKDDDGPTIKETDSGNKEDEIDEEPQEESSGSLLTARKAAYNAAGEIVRITSYRADNFADPLPSDVVNYIRCRADGTCEQCDATAPFETSDNVPYLELHHQAESQDSESLALDPDAILALCPNCHAEVHQLD